MGSFLIKRKTTIVDLRISKVRFIVGLVFIIVGFFMALLLISKTSKKHLYNDMQTEVIRKQEKDIDSVRTEVDRIKLSKRSLNEFISSITTEDANKVHWDLSNILFELSNRHDVKILNIKYAPASRLIVSGDTLESSNVDFDISGIYIKLKAFMLALEKSNHNFTVVEAKLEESVESGHLSVKLFALWRSAPKMADRVVPSL